MTGMSECPPPPLANHRPLPQAYGPAQAHISYMDTVTLDKRQVRLPWTPLDQRKYMVKMKIGEYIDE